MISFLLNVHTAFVPIVLLAGAISLCSGAAAYVTNRMGSTAAPPVARVFRVALWVTAGIGVIQAIWGGLLFASGCRPADSLHFVYGGIVLLAIPVAYAYSDEKSVRRDILIMSIAAVAIIGAGVRALMTGPGGVCM